MFTTMCSQWIRSFLSILILFGWIATSVLGLVGIGQALGETLRGKKREGQADVVVVCPKPFVPGLEAWIKHRTKQGFRIHLIDSHSDPRVVLERIRIESQRYPDGIRFVVLAADAPSIQAECDPKNSIPTFYLQSEVVHKFGSESTIASDLPYSDLDGDMVPDVAIGRIAADSEGMLREYLNRVIRYEDSSDFGEWRHKVDVVAGVGGFGAIADGAIELVTRRFLTDGIPDQFTLGMTYASPTSVYCPNPFEFHSSLVNRLNSGSLFWIYIGHGHIGTLDQFQIGDKSLDILNTRLLEKVAVDHGPPIAVFLACYTGAFDAPQDCLAERMTMLPNGPIAALAGTRMTMPYGMSALGAELLDSCFIEQSATLGELVLAAKQRAVHFGFEKEQAANGSNEKTISRETARQRMLEALARALSPEGHDLAKERAEHTRLMHLLGDPTLMLYHPQRVDLASPLTANPGSKFQVIGVGPPESKNVKLELAYRRDRLPPNVQGRKSFRDDPESLKEMDETHRAANNLILWTLDTPCIDGRFQCDVPIPPEVRGKVILRAFMPSDDGIASGSSSISIRAQ